MKKAYSIAIILALLLSLAAGCSGGNTPAVSTADPESYIQEAHKSSSEYDYLSFNGMQEFVDFVGHVLAGESELQKYLDEQKEVRINSVTYYEAKKYPYEMLLASAKAMQNTYVAVHGEFDVHKIHLMPQIDHLSIGYFAPDGTYYDLITYLKDGENLKKFSEEIGLDFTPEARQQEIKENKVTDLLSASSRNGEGVDIYLRGNANKVEGREFFYIEGEDFYISANTSHGNYLNAFKDGADGFRFVLFGELTEKDYKPDKDYTSDSE